MDIWLREEEREESGEEAKEDERWKLRWYEEAVWCAELNGLMARACVEYRAAGRR